MSDQGWSRGRNLLSALMAASCVLALTACTDRTAKNESAGQQLDAAVDKTEKATAAAAEKAAELAEAARDKTKAYFNSPEVRQDVGAVKDAVKNLGGAAVSTTDDAAITMSVSSALAKDPELNAAHIDVQTKAGTVRLAGAAPAASAKARAEQIAKGVKGVGAVDNALEVRAM